jgi:hypothetical protein
MTPKEKAKELVDKHCANHFEQKRGSIIINLEKAKKSALISVELVLSISYLLKQETYFYKNVKQEILKL